MECNCNNNNSNGGVIPWVRGNRLPLIICVYENVVTQEQVGDSTLTVNEMTRVPYTIQDNDTVTVTMKSGFRQVEMPFTTDGNKVMVTDNGELPTGAYTVEVTIERGDGARGRWQETRQVRIYENTSDAQLGEMYSIDADLFFYAKGDTGTGIADITNNPDGTLTITMTDGTSYVTEALKGDKGDKGDTGERGVSIVSFDVTGQTDVSVVYTVTFSDDTTQDISVPKGPQGDTGLTGNGISSTTLNSDYTLTIAYTDGTTYTTPSIRGAQGAQGVSVIGFTQTGETATNTMYNLVFSDGRTQSVAIPKGVKGDKGDTGATGATGAQGPKGDTVTATDYTLYNVQGSDSQGAMSQDATTKAISAQTGYYTCGAAADKVDKVAAVENGNLYKRTLGGHFKVKMTNANTASGVTLQVGSETATTLWYNGAAVSASNTWDAGEVISVYYDGTYYQASNAQGGGSAVGKKRLYGRTGFNTLLNVGIGNTVGAASSDPPTVTYEQKVNEGDVICITAQGANAGRCWGFIDSNRKLLAVEDAAVFCNNKVLVVPAGVDKAVFNALVTDIPNINGYPNYEWYYAKAGSVGAHEMLTEAYLYGDLRTLSVGQVYEKDEAVKTTDKQFLRITKDITALSLSETLATGDIRVSGSKTYRAASAVNTFNPSTSYSESAYALGNMTVYTLTITAESVTAGNITVNGTDVAIEDTDDAAAIASKIASALVIDGWTDSASENIVTVRCNTIGNNTTTITIDAGDTGVVVSGDSTPSVTGTDVIMKYNGESWSTATSSGMVTDGILVEVDEAWLIINATQQNTLLKDITVNEEINLASISRVNCYMFQENNVWKWQNNYTTSGGNWGKFIPVEGGRTYILEALQYTDSIYGFLKDNTHVTGAITNYATGETGHTLVHNTTVAIVAPFDAKYLFISTNNATTNKTPKAVYTIKYIEDIKKSQDITEDYLYGNLKAVALGTTYDIGAIIINSDGTSLKITKEVNLMNLNDPVQTGDFKVYAGHTYKAVKDIPVYSGEDSDYTSGDYAIINNRVNSFNGSAWTALTNISTYVSNTEYWKSLTVDELVSEVTDKTYNTEYSIETLYYRDGTVLSSPNTSAGAPTVLSGFSVIAGHTYRIYIKSKSSIPGTLKLGLGSNGNISITAASILNGYTWNKTATTTADSRVYLDGSTVTGIEIYTKIQDITDPSTISTTKKTSIKEKIQELDSRIDSSTDSISGLADSVSEITKTYDTLVERDVTDFVGTIIAGGGYTPVSDYLTVSPTVGASQNGVATVVSPKAATRFGWYIGALPINIDIIVSMDIVSSRIGGQSAFDKNTDGGTINTINSGGSIITRWYDSDSTSNIYDLTTTVTNYKFVIRRTNSIKFMMCPTGSCAAGQTITISNFSAVIRCSQYDYERFFTRPEQKMMLRAATSSNGQVKDANAVSILHFSDIHGDGTAAFAIRSFYDDNASDIDDILNTGDTVQSKFTNDFDFYLKAHLTDALYCLGNHDGATVDNGYWTGTARNQVYARYIGSYAESWGITQPENAVTDSLMYWYKDYTTQKIRLICLDTVWSNADANYKTAELAWFRSVLSDAAANDFKVVVCSHYLPGYCDEEDIVKNQLDSPNNMHDYDFTLVPDSFGNYDKPDFIVDYITAVESFIHNDNGTFIVWLCGHLHNSLFWRAKGHPDILGMTIDCAGNIAGSWHKYHRFKRGLEDCFCAHQIIINGQYIKCIQLGFQVDKLLRSSKSLTYDYINKKVISEN